MTSSALSLQPIKHLPQHNLTLAKAANVDPQKGGVASNSLPWWREFMHRLLRFIHGPVTQKAGQCNVCNCGVITCIGAIVGYHPPTP